MFDSWNCLGGTKNDVYRRRLLISSIYRCRNGIWKLRLLVQPSSPELFLPVTFLSTDGAICIGSNIFNVPPSDPIFKSNRLKKMNQKNWKKETRGPLLKKNSVDFFGWIFNVWWLELFKVNQSVFDKGLVPRSPVAPLDQSPKGETPKAENAVKFPVNKRRKAPWVSITWTGMTSSGLHFASAATRHIAAAAAVVVASPASHNL